MGIQIYKPNSSNRGSACHWKFNSKDKAIYIEITKQVSWNPNTRIGSFKGGVKGCIKLKMEKVGEIIDVIEKTLSPKTNIYRLIKSINKEDGSETFTEQLVSTSSPQTVEFSDFHQSSKKTQIKFCPYFNGKTLGFSLSFTKIDLQNSTDKQSFVIGITSGEAVLLREYLKFALLHCFNAIYSEDKKLAEKYAERFEERNHQIDEEPAQEEVSAPAQQEEDEDIF